MHNNNYIKIGIYINGGKSNVDIRVNEMSILFEMRKPIMLFKKTIYSKNNKNSALQSSQSSCWYK